MIFYHISIYVLNIHLLLKYCFPQDNQEKPAVPFVQLNVIRLFAELSAAVNKSELVDVILPLFIESLEEGDASTPSLLRLRVWNFIFNIL